MPDPQHRTTGVMARLACVEQLVQTVRGKRASTKSTTMSMQRCWSTTDDDAVARGGDAVMTLLFGEASRDGRQTSREGMVCPRSVDQDNDMRVRDDDGDIDGGAFRSVVATTSWHRWTCRRRGATHAGVLVTPQATLVASLNKMRKPVLLKPMSRTRESTAGGRRKPDL
jgi:hypothetical protein